VDKIIYMANGVVRTINANGTEQTDIPVKLKYKQAMPHGVTVIHAGFLWDGVSPVLREDVDIMLVDNRIVQIRDHNPKAKPKAERFIDASDLTVLPGLWDSHLHPRVRDYTGGTWAIMLAYGITSVQSYGCSPYTTFLGKESLESGNIVGPRLFTSFIFDGARSYYAHHRSVMNHDVLELELDRAEEMGYDHLKPYVRADALQFALIAERAHNMRVPSASHFISPGIQTGILNNAHLAATNRAGFQWAVSSRDYKAYQDVMALFTKDDYHLCSTHGGRYLVGETPELIEDDRFTLLMPPYFAARYVNDAQAPPTQAQMDYIRRSVVPAVQILQKGGTVSIGTDSPVAAPALGVHMALRAFADTRLGNATNHETLLAATINSAKLSHADHELGTIEVGKIADLVMIDGNPLEDIADLVNVEMVMKNGVIYTIPEILEPYLPNE
jgi:hypothetical protein